MCSASSALIVMMLVMCEKMESARYHKRPPNLWYPVRWNPQKSGLHRLTVISDPTSNPKKLCLPESGSLRTASGHPCGCAHSRACHADLTPAVRVANVQRSGRLGTSCRLSSLPRAHATARAIALFQAARVSRQSILVMPTSIARDPFNSGNLYFTH